MKTVTITSCNNSVEAAMLQSLLENEGIASMLSNENYTCLYPNMNGAMGSGIQILVNETDAEKAFEIICGCNQLVHCPKCSSQEVMQVFSKNWLARIGVVVLALITFTPVGNMQSKYQCKECGNKFVI